MWLTIGFMCLGFFAVVMFWHRVTAEWQGARSRHNGIAYQYRVYEGNRSRRIKAGMTVSRRYDFVIRRHGWFDRLLAHVGMDSDKRICNAAFDNSLVILSDDFTASQALAAAPGLSDRLLKMFAAGSRDTIRIEKIVCRRGRLWVLVEDKSQDSEQRNALADLTLPAMSEFAEALNRLEGPEHSQRADRYAVPAVALMLLTTGFMTKGVLDWIQSGAEVIDATVLMQSVVFGGLVALALVVGTIRLMRFDFSRHKVIAELFFVGMLGASATLYADRAGVDNLEMAAHEQTNTTVRIEG